ncbi:uncharacterized protein LOC143367494 isoform X2 [Andrena cerasifolii]
MAGDISNLKAKCLQRLKKRKIEVHDESSDDTKNNFPSHEKADTNVECDSNENAGIFTQNFSVKDTLIKTDNSDDHSQTRDSSQDSETNDPLSDLIKDEEEDAEVVNDNNHSCKLTDSQRSLISIRRIEDLRVTPKKNVGTNEQIDTSNIKTENRNNAQTFSPSSLGANSIEWHSQTVKGLPETPSSCKKERHHPNKSNNSGTQRKRKMSSDSDDYELLSDSLKSELYDTDLNDVEAIDMLHDLNSIMDFEDTKLCTHFLSSTVNDNLQNEYNLELSRDPRMDPLYIADNDEQGTTSEDSESDLIREEPQAKFNSKKRRRNQHNGTNRMRLNDTRIRKSDSNTEDDDETYDIIKNILGEFNINMESENEELLDDSSKQKLYVLQVKMMHEVPPQHRIEHSSGAKPLSLEEKQLFFKYGPMKQGVFSPKEDEIIIKNWEAFCKVHKWNPKHTEPFRYMRQDSKFTVKSKRERKAFVQFLANGLPWRTLYSVYQRFRILYRNSNHKKPFQRYTSVEDGKILSYLNSKHVKENKRHCAFSELAKVLGRTSESVRLRYQLLKKVQQDQSREQPVPEVIWTVPLISKFIKTLMDVTLCEEVEDLKDASIPKPVWQKLEEKLNIDQNILKVFWMHQLHMQLFCPERIYLNDIKIKLIEYIYGKGISSTREIIWPNVVKYFEGITTVFLCKLFFYLVQEATTRLNSKNFPGIVGYLYHDKIHEIRNEQTDKFLPRLSYNNGEVDIVDEDESDDIKA